MTLSLTCLCACHDEAEKTIEKKNLIIRETKNTEKLYFSGELKPLRETALSVSVDAKIKTLNFTFGSWVKRGALLMELDSPEQQKEYDEALTTYLKAKDDLDVAIAKFSGTQSLWKDKLVSENMYKSDKSALFTNKISFFQAKAKLVSMAKKLSNFSTKEMLALSLNNFDRVQAVLNKHKNTIIIKAPHEGIVLLPPKTEASNELRVGSLVKGGEVMALIGDISGLALTIKVPEINIGKIKQGMKAEVTGIAFPHLVLKGVVQSINAQANIGASDPSGGLPIFTAKVVIPKLTMVQKDLLKIGMSASVNVILKERLQIMIPIAALTLEGDKTWVTLKNQQGEEEKIFVETGISTDDSVEIVSGLKKNDCLVWTQK